METNITRFRCPQCGGRSLVQVTVGATVLEGVASAVPGSVPGTATKRVSVTTRGQTVVREDGRCAGYACASCRWMAATDVEGLLAFVGEWRDEDKLGADDVGHS